jgi:ligand-binding sensor domain-containing protein
MTTGPDGRVWAFINGVLSRRDAAGWRTVANGSFNEVFLLAIDKQGSPWGVFEPGIATITNPTVIVSRYRNGRWGGYALPFQRGATALAHDSSRGIWVGTSGYGIYQIDSAGHIDSITTANSPLPSDTINNIQAGKRGEIWIATPRGLARFSGGEWQIFREGEDAFPYPNIRGMAVDPSGALWGITGVLARPGSPSDTNPPLVRYDGSRWSRIEGSPLSIGRVTSIAAGSDGTIWLGHVSQGVAAYAGAAAGLRTGEQERTPVMALPNPFADQVLIRIPHGGMGRISADIVDARGTIVRRLEEWDVEESAFLWDGTAAGGEAVSDGLYFCRARAGTGAWTIPLIRRKK